jgi:hypothetical protein
MKNPSAFEDEMKSLTDTAQAIFIIRSVTSMVRAIANSSPMSLAQVAFDIFHFLFRDRILDLQNVFPANKRIIDKYGVDKGPFWGEKKKYPTVVQFNVNDESHISFITSTACLLGVSIGYIPPKEEEDEHWCDDYRKPEFVANLLPNLNIPEYIFSPVNTADSENENDDASNTSVSKMPKDDVLSGLLKDLATAYQHITNMVTMKYMDFEKDDDFNFHIAFVTSAANLRCDNYSIKRTNFHSCKVIAGKIIAAIATTTAAVCGLVILELFKLQQSKSTEAYMNRQIGLATNTFTSFTAEPPMKFRTTTEKTVPAPEDATPDMYDASGEVKPEFMVMTVKKAYPENHTIWDKIVCPASQTLRDFSKWLESEHGLRLLSWDFIIGYKRGVDEEGKRTGLEGVSTLLYPPRAVLDPSLLPALDLTLPQATQALMRARAQPTQEYIQLWKESKARGAVDLEGLARRQGDAVTPDTPIRDLLARMEALGARAQLEGRLELCAVTGIDHRVFWVVPANETPRCKDLATDLEVEHLAAIKFILGDYSG